MNTTEQKNHKSRMDKLESDLEGALETFKNETNLVIYHGVEDAVKRIGEERTARLRLAKEQREYVDAMDSELGGRLLGLVDRVTYLELPFWKRWAQDWKNWGKNRHGR